MNMICEECNFKAGPKCYHENAKKNHIGISQVFANKKSCKLFIPKRVMYKE